MSETITKIGTPTDHITILTKDEIPSPMDSVMSDQESTVISGTMEENVPTRLMNHNVNFSIECHQPAEMMETAITTCASFSIFANLF